jgi:subtilisin family serine protease
MNKNYRLLLFCLFLLNSLNLFSQNEYIIKFKSEKNLQNYQIQSKLKLNPLFNLSLKNKLPEIQTKSSFQYALYYKISGNQISSQDLIDLRNDKNIEYVEPNHIYSINKSNFPNDSLYQYQWALQEIQAQNAWQKADGDGIIVGIVDTGIDFEHIDLKGSLWINSKEDINHDGVFEPWDVNEVRNGVTGDLNGIDDDGNGVADDVIGYDFVNQDYANFGDWTQPDPIPEDQANHGTSVAGVIAATGNNKIGVIGLAYKSKILTAKAFDATGNAQTDNIAAAIIYAANNGAKIINMSFGDTFESHLLQDAVNYALSLGCVLVASSGNESNGLPHFPSDFDGVISVGASKINYQMSAISNYGVNLSILAPGENILTTVPGNDYQQVSGTSFSAPYVSAAIALLLQLHPNLNQSEIRSTLEAQAHPIASARWNNLTGAGILDVDNLLNYKGLSDYDFLNVPNFTYFQNSINDSLAIKLNVETPLFDSYQIEYCDVDSNKYYPISNLYKSQVSNSILPFKLNMQNNTIKLSLKINLKDGTILRREKEINLINPNEKVNVQYFAVNPAIKNGQRVILVSARTNEVSNFWLEFWNDQNPDLKYRIDEQMMTSTDHLIELNSLIQSGHYSGIAYFTLMNINKQNIDTTTQNFAFNFIPQTYPTLNYTQKSYSLPRAYLNNFIYDFYNDKRDAFIINNMQNYDIGTTEVYEFQNNQFIKKDTTNGWIPVGVGNTKVNNNLDILLTQNAKTILTTNAGNFASSPFSNIEFSSDLAKTFWGEALADIDKDGVDEIIAYNDTTYYTYKYNQKQNQYLVYQIAELDSNSKKLGVTKGSAIGDFDGDGNIELMHSNYYGDIFIFEFRDGKFNLEFADTTHFGYSNPVVTKINLPGVPNPCIVIGTYSSKLLYGKEDPTTQIWSYRLIRSIGVNQYKVSNFENVMGVRAGFDRRLGVSYRNGITAGDLEKDNSDELIISAFPNTYVLKWMDSAFVPVWRYPYSYTNSAIIWDFDKNGKNEIGISTYDSTRFFELSYPTGKPLIPQITDAYSFQANEGKIKWDNVAGAQDYKVYQLNISPDGSFSLQVIAKVNVDSVIIGNLSENNFYYFMVTSIDSSKSIPESDFSEIVTIFAHRPLNLLHTKVINNHTVLLHFDGKLKSYLSDMNSIKIQEVNGSEVFLPTSIQLYQDSSYIVQLANELSQGEYIAQIGNFRDYWNNPIIPSSVYFEVGNLPNPDELYLKSLEILTLNLYKLVFSEPVEQSTAETINNYALSPWGSVIVASRDPKDSDAVLLFVNDEIARRNIIGEQYSITVSNVVSSSNKPMTKGAGNTLSFVLNKPNLEQVISFPNPVRLSTDEFLTFGNLTREAEITIMDLNGKELKKINEINGDGGIKWDLKDNSGNVLVPGIYLYKITGKNSDGIDVLWDMKKFVVLP